MVLSMQLSRTFRKEGGAFRSFLSRRFFLFLLVLYAMWESPFISSSIALWVGRTTLIFLAALAVPWIFASWLPRIMVPNVEKRAILITGCSSGLGFDAALALDAAGALVIGACRNPNAEGPQRLLQQASPRLRLVRMDVTVDASVDAAVPAVKEALGDNELWAVVNNAGRLGVGDCEMIDIDDVKDLMNLNLFGALRVTRAFLPLLKKSKGRIVNMISILCRVSLGSHSPYTMSKYALLAMTESLRHEVRRYGISVHSVEPWFYKTPLTQSSPHRIQDMWQKCPEKVKKTLSDSYIKRLTTASKFYLNIVSLPSSQIKRVSDTIIDACLAQDPKDRYVPWFLAELAAIIANIFPNTIQLVHDLANYYVGE